MGVYTHKKQQVVQEVYFGKTKEVLALEKAIHEIRVDFVKRGTKTNSAPSIQKFNRLAESTFGIKRFALRIDFAMLSINAYTMPLSIKLDNIGLAKKFKPTKNSMKFAEGTDFCCIVNLSAGLLLADEMSDAEVLAIILHEIGHNFSSCLSTKSAMLTSINKVLISVDIIKDIILEVLNTEEEKNGEHGTNAIISSIFMLNIFDKIRLNILKNDKVNDSLALVSFIFGIVSSVIGRINFIRMLFRPLSYLLTLIYKTVYTLISYLPPIYFIHILQYREEQMADSFANMYGYGPELVSGLDKMSKASNEKSDILLRLNEIMFLPVIMLSLPVEPHPDDISRIKNNLEYLNKELKDCDPRMRKEINEQISEIEKTLDFVIKDCQDADIRTFGFSTKMYSAFMYDHFGGDPRDILMTNDSYEQIEKHYNDSINKK